MSYLERFIKSQIMVFYGLGLLYTLQLLGIINLTVQGINISPSQAETIQKTLDYTTDGDVINPPRKRR